MFNSMFSTKTVEKNAVHKKVIQILKCLKPQGFKGTKMWSKETRQKQEILVRNLMTAVTLT